MSSRTVPIPTPVRGFGGRHVRQRGGGAAQFQCYLQIESVGCPTASKAPEESHYLSSFQPKNVLGYSNDDAFVLLGFSDFPAIHGGRLWEYGDVLVCL